MQSNPPGTGISTGSENVDWLQVLQVLQNSHTSAGSRYPRYGAHEFEDVHLGDQPLPPRLEPDSSASSSSTSLNAAARAATPAPPQASQYRLDILSSVASQHQPSPHAQGHRGLLGGPPGRGLHLLGQLSRRTQAAAATVAAVAAAGGGGAGQVDDGAASVSASAERYRLTSESTGINLQAMAEWIADLVPFVLLMLWVFLFKHLATLAAITFLAMCTHHANADIRRLVALRREASPGACLRQAACVAVLTGAALAMALPDSRLLSVLSLRPLHSTPAGVAAPVGAEAAEALSATDALLVVLLADSLIRFASLAPKLAVLAWFRAAAGRAPSAGGGSSWAGGGTGGIGGAGGGGSGGGGWSHLGGARQLRQQTRVLTVVERGVALYRAVMPAPVWYGFFLRSFPPVLASLFTGFYLVAKVSSLATQARLLALAVMTATRRSALYGSYVGRGDAGEGGGFGACPVCQDPVQVPLRLDCGHIFCEECILEWLERDRTCPMCRAQVRPTGLPTCSDGASPLLPQLF